MADKTTGKSPTQEGEAPPSDTTLTRANALVSCVCT